MIEILSPAYRRLGSGRTEYDTKREEVLSSESNFVEIDLLRAGQRMRLDGAPDCDYRVLVSPAWERPEARLIPFDIREEPPVLPIPLRQGEVEVDVELRDLLHTVYDRGSYDRQVDYFKEPEPSLSEEDADWADALPRAAAVRPLTEQRLP